MSTPDRFFWLSRSERGRSALAWLALAGALLSSPGCDGDGSAPGAANPDPIADVGSAAADTGADLGPPSDAGDLGPPADTGSSADTPRFSTLGAWLDGLVERGVINGYALVVFGADDAVLFEGSAGRCELAGPCRPAGTEYTADLSTGVASSSKWVASTIALAAVEDEIAAGRIANLTAGLDAPLGGILDCGAPIDEAVAGITLRHLLSFTSGLASRHDCVGVRGGDVVECACDILATSAGVRTEDPNQGDPRRRSHPPGTVYVYSETDLVVAMALVEQLTGQPWTDYFTARVAGPAGMGNAAFANPLKPSGSLRASVRQYAAFVATIFHDGREGAGVVLSREAVAEQQANQMPPGIVRRASPQPELDYGLNNWRWCFAPVNPGVLDDPAQIVAAPGCDSGHQTGHAGKGGFGPWIDVDRGIYGVFAMREEAAGDAPADYSIEELNILTVVRLYAGLAADLI